MKTSNQGKLQYFFKEPNYSVIMVFAIFIVIVGLIGLTPLSIFAFAPGGAMFIKYAACAVYISSGLYTLWGYFTKNKKVLLSGSYGVFLSYLFATIIRISFYGLVPTQWIFPFAIAVAVAVCRISAETPK